MQESVRLSALVEKRRMTGPWAGHSWHVLGVVTDPPAETWTDIRKTDLAVTCLTAPVDVAAHKSDTGNYRDNLHSGAPKLWVVLRPTEDENGCELALITADPDEGESMTQDADLIVEAVAMPEVLRLWLDSFVRQHHVERPFHKRKRD
jgi:hypothetical protein